jgi:hypothetical protein
VVQPVATTADSPAIIGQIIASAAHLFKGIAFKGIARSDHAASALDTALGRRAAPAPDFGHP